jgi:hypothetical protein
METFAQELKDLVERWRGFNGTSDEEIIEALMDETEKLEGNDD